MKTRLVHDGLQKMLNHFEKYGFLKISGNLEIKFNFGSPGQYLLDNIRNEWLYSSAVYREENVFRFSSPRHNILAHDIKDGFLMAKQLSNGVLPFGLVDIRITHKKEIPNEHYPNSNTILRYIGFQTPKEGNQFFYTWLQQRKRWWRKFSTDPGKFEFSEVKEIDDVEEAEIIAKFPWGEHEVEKIRFLGTKPFEVAKGEHFQVSDGKTNGYPHVIESSCSLEYAAFTYLCDSYTETDRTYCRFHRKLAPYKFAFAFAPVDEKYEKQLYDMCLMLCLDLRKNGIVCLQPNKLECGKQTLDLQLNKFNSLGVPYTLVLNEESLNTGIFGIYSRETTLQEQYHIDKMSDYGFLLMKNY